MCFLLSIVEVSVVLRYCFDNNIKVVFCGVGIFLFGGVLFLVDGIFLGMVKFNKIVEIDYVNWCVVI